MIFKNTYTNKKLSVLMLFFVLITLYSIFYLDSAVAHMYKCADEDNNISYIDTPCLDETRQDLDIIVAPIDEVSSERLKEIQDVDFPEPRVRNKITVIERERPSKQCEGYIKQIRQMKKKLNSGYTAAQGDAIQRSIDAQRKAYDKSCK
ncbi:MAG: hypothetical protein OEY66_06040 [Gammaproteobacteria bacterium]|nr:hypothetical protein [Gammaproteobacteria bacterium]